jgi:hypothetical protein
LIGAWSPDQAAELLGVSVSELRRQLAFVSPDRVGALDVDTAALAPVGFDVDTGLIRFLEMRDVLHREPFFHETVARARREHADSLDVEVSLPAFVRAGERCRTLPAGFLFHTGRCGSTLLANMLSSSGEHVVVKEPDIVSDLMAAALSAPGVQAAEELAAALGVAVSCLVAAARPAAPYPWVKLAAWNVRLAHTLLERFPGAPAVFVYRAPRETVASLLHQRPSWFDLIECPRALQARFFPTVAEVPEGRLSPVVLFAHAFRSAAEAALALPPERTLLVEYQSLVSRPEAVIEEVLRHARQPQSPGALEKMVAARSTYSKDPAGASAFDPKGTHRRPPLSSSDGAQVDAIAAESWVRLEARRSGAGLGDA